MNKQEPIESCPGVYGTHQQTVILVDRKGKVTYVERTLYDENIQPKPKDQRERRFEFEIEDFNATSMSR